MLDTCADNNTTMINAIASQDNSTAQEKSNLGTSLNRVRNTLDQQSNHTINQTAPLSIKITNENGLLICASSEHHDDVNKAANFQGELQKVNSPPIKVYMHTTAEENLSSIHKKGLIAGGDSPPVAGMGDAYQGKPCSDGIYVVIPKSSIGVDARSGVVGIASNGSPTHDVNYPRGRAGVFLTDEILPLREAAKPKAMPSPNNTLHPSTSLSPYYSFVPAKISPNTKNGAAAFYAQNGVHLSPNSAAKTLVQKLKENYPVHTLDIQLSNSSDSTEEIQRSLSFSSNTSDHDNVDKSNARVINNLIFDDE